MLGRTCITLAMLALAAGCGQQKEPVAPGNGSGLGNGSSQGRSEFDDMFDMMAGEGSSGPADSPYQKASTSSSDTYAEDVVRVRDVVPTWAEGTGVVLKFLNEDTGQRMSFVFVDERAPGYFSETDTWTAAAQATSEGRTFAWVGISARDFAPGTLYGSPDTLELVMSLVIGDRFDGEADDACWSFNPGGWAELTLRPGRSPGDVEGEIRGKLIANDTASFYTIEEGYIYINR